MTESTNHGKPNPIPCEDPGELAERVAAKLARYATSVQDLTEKFRVAERTRWRQLVDPLVLDGMLNSREAAEQGLSDRDPAVRLVAISVLGSQWNCDALFAEKCEGMAISDPDDDVRATALNYLALFHGETANHRITKFYAAVVRDTSESTKVRTVAYQCLFTLRGVPPRFRPTIKILQRQFRFPEDVDWEFVDGILARPQLS